MKINIYVRVIAAVLALLWMARIFSYSSDNAEASTAVSRSVSFDLVKSASDLLGLGWDEDKIRVTSLEIEKTVRKLAHMAEYAVLGVLVCVACDARMTVPFLACLVYAFTDEFHQTFVDGRSGELGDVMIDVFGAAMAILVTVRIVGRIRAKRVKKDAGQITDVITGADPEDENRSE